jgi:hypothetical protein
MGPPPGRSRRCGRSRPGARTRRAIRSMSRSRISTPGPDPRRHPRARSTPVATRECHVRGSSARLDSARAIHGSSDPRHVDPGPHRRPAIDRTWVEALVSTADASAGLHLIPEPDDLAASARWTSVERRASSVERHRTSRNACPAARPVLPRREREPRRGCRARISSGSGTSTTNGLHGASSARSGDVAPRRPRAARRRIRSSSSSTISRSSASGRPGNCGRNHSTASSRISSPSSALITTSCPNEWLGRGGHSG